MTSKSFPSSGQKDRQPGKCNNNGGGGECNESWVFRVGRQLTQAREGESGVHPRVKTRDKSPRRETPDEKKLHLGTPDGKDVITSN